MISVSHLNEYLLDYRYSFNVVSNKYICVKVPSECATTSQSMSICFGTKSVDQIMQEASVPKPLKEHNIRL